MDRAALAWARRLVLARDPSAFDPDALLFLLVDYVGSGQDDVRAAVEQGLTHALAAAPREQDACRRVQWLRVLTEAGTFTDDERLRDTIARELPLAIDALERFVRRGYEPGEGLIDAPCEEQLRCGSALLAGFDLSGRLPYAMLAEELLQHARRHWWNAHDGTYDGGFDANCHALGVLCRLTRLHADAGYAAAAVVAPTRPYASEARRVAAALVARAQAHPGSAAAFGCALLEWFALEPKLQ